MKKSISVGVCVCVCALYRLYVVSVLMCFIEVEETVKH